MEGDVITLQDIFLFDNSAGFDSEGRSLGTLQGHRSASEVPREDAAQQRHRRPADLLARRAMSPMIVVLAVTRPPELGAVLRLVAIGLGLLGVLTMAVPRPRDIRRRGAPCRCTPRVARDGFAFCPCLNRTNWRRPSPRPLGCWSATRVSRCGSTRVSKGAGTASRLPSSGCSSTVGITLVAGFVGTLFGGRSRHRRYVPGSPAHFAVMPARSSSGADVRKAFRRAARHPALIGRVADRRSFPGPVDRHHRNEGSEPISSEFRRVLVETRLA